MWYVHLDGLALAAALDDLAGHDRGRAGGHVEDFRLVVGQVPGGDHLHRREAGSIRELQEAEARLGVPSGPSSSIAQPSASLS